METKVVELELNDVLPNRFQPRIKFNEQSIQDLANSIKEHGVIQPIVVRKIGDKFEIIAGERRYKASVLAGKTTIPAIVTDLNEKESAEVALIENIQRKDLTPIEEAVSYKKILDMGLTQDILASKLGKTQSTIANKIRLLNLDDEVQEALLNEQISERHARSLLRITNNQKQREMLKRIINERLTVRKADEEIDKMTNNDENIEVLNFGGITEQPSNNSFENHANNYNQPIEELEVFNPTIETLNIPTAPIVDDTIPEELPSEKPELLFSENPVEIFNPSPEIINPTLSPISESTYNSKEVVTPFESVPESLNNNIPTEPINESKTEELETNEFINPGFMDINKIETEAKEIYEEKPLAPVENLLEPSFTNLEPSTIPVEETSDDSSDDAENILVPGKFFNLMPEEDSEIEKEQEEPVDNFNFDLDINSLNNIESTNNISPIEDVKSMNVDSILQETVQPLEKQVESISPQPILNPLNNENSIHEIPVPLAPESTSIGDSIAELEIPEINNFNSLPDLENITSNEEEYEPAPIVHPVNSSVDLKTAINMVRDFSEQLSRMGYVIDTDEFDFEDMYQIIFKINK